MGLKIGDCVKYGERDISEEDIKGKIIAISNKTTDIITTYLVILVSGQYVQFTSDNLKWCKLEEPILKHRVIQSSPLTLPLVLKACSCPSNYYDDRDDPFSLLVNVY